MTAPVAAAPVVEAPAFVPLTPEAFTFPEGFSLDEKAMTPFLEIVNNRALSVQEQAQALVNLQANLQRTSSETGSRSFEEQQQNWQAAVAADPEIGGANLQKTIGNIASILDRFGNEEVRAAFDIGGVGNHPAVVKFLNTLASQLGEAPSVPLGGAPAGIGGAKTADLMFGQTAKPN